MATLCKNCSHALVFDPGSQRLVCSYCGSTFKAEEVESDSKDYRQDLNAESLNEVYGGKEEKFMDCYVYSCSECGGEIIVNGTEASTACVYCGNSNVVFSRIAKQKCPEFIIPFSITKERAIELVHEKIDKGFFVPKKLKTFIPDCIRGIYVPYWIVNGEYADSVVVRGTVQRGKSKVTRYYGRAGSMKLKDFPIDASRALSDETSSKLEPFDLSHMKPFDEDYLAGFYSNVSDVTYSDVRNAAFARAKEYFNEDAMNNVRAGNCSILDSCPSLRLDSDMIYAMMPVWFITFKYEGKHNTILINGDNGKVVCGLPWNKKLFYTLLTIFGIISVTASYFLFYFTMWIFYNGAGIRLLAMIFAGALAMLVTGTSKLTKVVKNLKLTQDKEVFSFMKKRQG